MNIYDAIMKAADQIEKHPESYRFSSGRPIGDAEGKGCPLAWIGHFLGIEADTHFLANFLYANKVCKEVCGTDKIAVFFELCSKIGEIANVKTAPKALRRYAKKYHTPQKPKFAGIPASIRAIFTDSPGEYVS